MKKKILIIVLILAAFFVYAIYHAKSKETLVYRENLDAKAVSVDGEVLTLRDLAFYVAFEEGKVEEQAMIYMPDNPNAYWNLHVDGKFVKLAAKEAVMDMAVHDQIFYMEAVKQGIELSQEDLEALSDSETQFWEDLSQEQKNAIGITEEELHDTLYRMTLAQKYQKQLADENGKDYAVYDIAGTAYSKIEEEHAVKINQSVWERIAFGKITISH